MTERPKKFRRDKESKIQSIVTATTELIEEKGYARFSVDDIPERAGLSIGTVYRYFPNGKSDILKMIIKRNNMILLEMIEPEDHTGEKFYDFWKRVIASYLKGHREGSFSFTAMRYTLDDDSQFKEILRPIVSEFFENLVSYSTNFSEVSRLPKNEIYQRIAIVFGIIGMLVKSHVERPLFKSDDSLIEYLLDVSRLTFEMKE